MNIRIQTRVKIKNKHKIKDNHSIIRKVKSITNIYKNKHDVHIKVKIQIKQQ